jgi:excisionase family DNA binding protein
MPKLYKVPQAAESLNVSPKTLWTWIAARQIEVTRLGRAVRIPAKALDDLIEAGTTPARVA